MYEHNCESMGIPSLVIRNVSQISSDEICLLVKLTDIRNADLLTSSPQIIQLQEYIQAENYAGIRELLKMTVIRDYLYECIKAKTGSHVILHLDESKNSDEVGYITSKLHDLPQNFHVSLLYFGGGHGGYIGLSAAKKLSGLSQRTVTQITKTLQHKNLTADAGILHSCNSALFVKFFRSLLSDLGVLLSYSAEHGASSNWQMTIEWLLDGKRKNFFASVAVNEQPLATVTSIISTKKINHFMDLEKSNGGLPDYVDTSDESELQRELVMHVFLEEEGIQSYTETDVNKYNEVVVMKQFNQHFDAAVRKNKGTTNQLIEILDKLITNISTQENGRQTLRNSLWKTQQLADIKQKLAAVEPKDIDINHYITDIRSICANKRNRLHFWAEPHSVSEFEELLLEEGLLDLWKLKSNQARVCCTSR